MGTLDNKLGRIWLVLILTAVVLVFKQSVANCGLFGRADARRYSYRKEDRFSPENLNNLIGYSLPPESGQFGWPHGYQSCRNDYYCRMRLVDLLAWTKDKSTPNTVLGKFSVNELLELNNYYEKDCTLDGMVEHRKKCAQLDPEQVRLEVDSRQYKLVENGMYFAETRDDKPLEYLKYRNLHKYCLRTLRQFERKCNLKNFSDIQIRIKLDTKVLDKFSKDLERHIEFNEIKSQFKYEDVVRKVLAKTKESEAEKVKANCENYVRELGRFIEESESELPADKVRHFELCKAVVS